MNPTGLSRAVVCGLALALALPVTAGAHPTVLLSGRTLLDRSLSRNLVLPDGTPLRLSEIRIRVPDVVADETLVCDLESGLIERHGGRKPLDILKKKSFGLSYLSLRSPKRGYFEAVRELSGAVNRKGVVVVVSEDPFLSP